MLASDNSCLFYNNKNTLITSFLSFKLEDFVNYIKFYEQGGMSLYYSTQDDKRWESFYIPIQEDEKEWNIKWFETLILPMLNIAHVVCRVRMHYFRETVGWRCGWRCGLKMWDEDVGWRRGMEVILHKIVLLVEGHHTFTHISQEWAIIAKQLKFKLQYIAKQWFIVKLMVAVASWDVKIGNIRFILWIH